MNTGIHQSCTAYERLANEVRDLIAKGEVRADGFIASEYDLARRFDMSRMTVRKGSELLIAEGIVQRLPGRGLFLAQDTAPKRKTIWVLVDNLAREPSVRLSRRIQKWAAEYSCDIQLMDGHGDVERNLVLLNELTARDDVSGAIITAWHTSECIEALCRLKDTGLPFVVLDHHNTYFSVPNVVADNYHGGRMAAEHFLENGHRNFAFIGDCKTITVRYRLDGFRDYLSEQGVLLSHPNIGNLHPDDRFSDWAEWVEQKMEKIFGGGRTNRPTALFVSCDNLARGVYRWCARNGVRIPEDLSVIGFDDDPVVQWLNPELTTIAQPFSEMGDKAIELLDSQIKGKPWDGKECILPVELIVRGSVRKI